MAYITRGSSHRHIKRLRTCRKIPHNNPYTSIAKPFEMLNDGYVWDYAHDVKDVTPACFPTGKTLCILTRSRITKRNTKTVQHGILCSHCQQLEDVLGQELRWTISRKLLDRVLKEHMHWRKCSICNVVLQVDAVLFSNHRTRCEIDFKRNKMADMERKLKRVKRDNQVKKKLIHMLTKQVKRNHMDTSRPHSVRSRGHLILCGTGSGPKFPTAKCVSTPVPRKDSRQGGLSTTGLVDVLVTLCATGLPLAPIRITVNYKYAEKHRNMDLIDNEIRIMGALHEGRYTYCAPVVAVLPKGVFCSSILCATIMTELHVCTLRDFFHRGSHCIQAQLDVSASAVTNRSLILCLVSAVHDLHILKIVHQDLKPSNMTINKNGVLCLIDWGLASSGPSRYIECVRHENCTRRYRRSGIFRAKPDLDKSRYWIDIFSVGITCIEIILGCTIGYLIQKMDISVGREHSNDRSVAEYIQCHQTGNVVFSWNKCESCQSDLDSLLHLGEIFLHVSWANRIRLKKAIGYCLYISPNFRHDLFKANFTLVPEQEFI